MGTEEERLASGIFEVDETPTRPSAPVAIRRESVPPREAWAFEREDPDGPVTLVSVMCGCCLRPFRMSPPRFAVSEEGEVVAIDEGAAFRCTSCDQPIGPLRLANWRLGRMG